MMVYWTNEDTCIILQACCDNNYCHSNTNKHNKQLSPFNQALSCVTNNRNIPIHKPSSIRTWSLPTRP